LLSRNGREWLAGRLVIPDVDERGKVIWMIGRILPGGPQQQRAIRQSEKYLGLPLPKGLLGYHRALAVWQSQQDELQAILLLEGAFDYVLARQWMLPVLPVALLGTYPSRSQWAQLLHLQRVSGLPVIDWHDADEPGRQAALQVHERVPGPLIPFPEIAGVNDLADLGLRPDGLVRLQHAWHAISDSREE
jgi:DNA primase